MRNVSNWHLSGNIVCICINYGDITAAGICYIYFSPIQGDCNASGIDFDCHRSYNTIVCSINYRNILLPEFLIYACGSAFTILTNVKNASIVMQKTVMRVCLLCVLSCVVSFIALLRKLVFILKYL